MRYIVIINLDYENYPNEQLKVLLADISKAMQDRGFLVDGRRFTIDVEPQEARRLAREVIEQMELGYGSSGQSVHGFIKEFYGFEVGSADNLLLPPDHDIEVDELDEVEGINLLDMLKG